MSLFARFAIVIVGCVWLFVPAAVAQPPSDVKRDEVIVFYPTYGRFDPSADLWRLRIHGKVYEPEESSIKRALLMRWIRSAAGRRLDARELREDRIRPFLVDNEGGKSVTIQIGRTRYVAGTSSSNGHFSSEIAVPAAAIQLLSTSEDSASEDNAPDDNAVEYRAVLREGDPRVFPGRVHLLAADGVSVISDIDDTIKDSRVIDKAELLRNTFIRDFKAVEGMPEYYETIHEAGATFHYVSGSPWQLYVPLEEFLSQAEYPLGTMHLKYFRLKDSSAFDLVGSQSQTKMAAIVPLLTTYPKRHFILIGDSGEQDPEIYGELARQYPDQITEIYIRNVTEASDDDPRFTTAFREIPDEKWTLFQNRIEE